MQKSGRSNGMNTTRSRKVIMILGAGIMQVPSYIAAKRNNWISVGVDANPDAVASKMADIFACIDLKDKEGILDKARELQKAGPGLDGVFTAGTDFSTSVAYVAEHLGLTGIPYETALNASDKSRMRRCFHQAGVPCPVYRPVDPDESLADAEKAARSVVGFPLVLKPVDNMGSRGVSLVEEPELFHDALSLARRYSRTGRVVVEQFMDGREYSIDALVYKGEVTVCGVADRHITFPPYFVEIGHTMPTELDKETVEQMLRVFIEGVRALGITNGAAKGDVFVTSRGPMIGEIAARLSGGYMSGWTFPYASGVPLTEAGMKIALGEDPGDLKPRHNRVSAERAFISIPGVVYEREGEQRSGESDGVKDIFFRADVGDTVRFPTNNVEKCGNVITCMDTRDAAIRAAERVIKTIRFRLEPDSRETEEFLFKDTGDAVHRAFTIDDPALYDSLLKMPWVTGAGSLNRVLLPVPLQDHALGGMKDWCAMTLKEVVQELDHEYSLVWVEYHEKHPLTEDALGRIFWRVVLKGGLQGGRYLLDTIRKGGMTALHEMVDTWDLEQSGLSC
jgi:biotin carboxylase